MDRSTATRRALTTTALLPALLTLGCALSPAPESPVPQVADRTGLVIGTLSYQYADQYAAAARSADTAPWVVRFERIDAGAVRQDYVLVVSIDPHSQSGVFSGVLPAGVYTFRNAAAQDREFAAGAFRLPFEVQAGRVQDAGHYAVSPVTVQALHVRGR